MSKVDKFNDVKDIHLSNIELISTTLFVIKFCKFSELIWMHPENIEAIFVTFDVSKFCIFISFNKEQS